MIIRRFQPEKMPQNMTFDYCQDNPSALCAQNTSRALERLYSGAPLRIVRSYLPPKGVENKTDELDNSRAGGQGRFRTSGAKGPGAARARSRSGTDTVDFRHGASEARTLFRNADTRDSIDDNSSQRVDIGYDGCEMQSMHLSDPPEGSGSRSPSVHSSNRTHPGGLPRVQRGVRGPPFSPE